MTKILINIPNKSKDNICGYTFDLRHVLNNKYSYLMYVCKYIHASKIGMYNVGPTW